MREFQLTTNVFFGADALDRLKDVNDKKVLLVCDQFIKESGMADEVASHLDSCQVFIYDKVTPDPSTEVIADGLRFLYSCRPEVMIGLGGGSPIDAAKAIRDLAFRTGYTDVEECFAIPTTSGTGSEVTKYSVVSDKQARVKYPLVSDSLQPMIAILAPELVKSVPPSVTADTGMDALAHALEAYVSLNSTDFTDALAEKAITLLFKFLPDAYKDGDDMLAREKVHNAACLAGMAFNAAGLGVCHSLAHAIGSKFHFPHGRCNGILLPYAIRFNSEADHETEPVMARKYQRIAKLIGLPFYNPQIGVNGLIRQIQSLNKTFGIPATFKGMGIEPDVAMSVKPEMIKDAMNDLCTSTNPREVTKENLGRLFDQVL